MSDGDTTLPPGTEIGRVNLVVHDLDRIEGYYRDTIGLEVLDRTADTVAFGIDEVVVSATERRDLAPRPTTAAGLFHLAVRVPTRDDLAAVAARLAGTAKLDGASDHGVSEALYTRDPAGNGVEIYRDRPRDRWPIDAEGVQMTTQPLDLTDLLAESVDARWLPDGADVGHVHLEVTDLEQSVAFYTETIGLAERDRRRGARFLAAGDYHHHLGLNTWGDRSERAHGLGLDSFTIEVPDSVSMGAIDSRIEAMPDDDGTIRLDDPDGIAIRIVHR